MTIPQLRLRTQFYFKNAFGPIPLVAEALAGLACPAAAIVDAGTWGHAVWSDFLKEKGIKPMFGCEFIIPRADGKKPSAWILAEDIRKFYNFTTAAQQKEVDMNELFYRGEGIIRFAGAALIDPEQFDYIDINPSSPLQQRAALRLHERTGKPLVVTSDNLYPRKQDYAAFMALTSRERMTPQHILSKEELRASLPCLTDAQFAVAVANTFEVAERCASKLPVAQLIHFDGDLRALAMAGKEYRLEYFHVLAWTEEYEARLQRELSMIAEKKFESYFLVVADLVSWAKKRMLVGPGRGSSAGSLVCYLLGITEVDPIPHGLLFERFIDITRAELPDIDLDFSDSKRDQCFTYLAERYGADKVARIGSINTLRPRSVMSKICERLAIKDTEKFDVLNVLIDYPSGDSRFGHSLEDTFTQTEPGRRFAAAHPEVIGILAIENHASHTGVHAAGIAVCNESISVFCTVGADGVAQIDKPYAEEIGLLKIDALGLRTLGVIEDAGVVTADELYSLNLDDPAVFALLNSHRYAGVFQFEGHAQRRVASEIKINSFRTIDHITALARPGPLGGGATNHYIARINNREEVSYRHPSMEAYLGSTFGVILYQEDIMRIVREIGQFDWEATSEIRKAISKSKGREYFNQYRAQFVKGALTVGMNENDAIDIWEEICTSGSYCMNKAHTTSYGVISYWCAWMKVYFPLQYAAACLRNAMDETSSLELLRDMKSEGIEYCAFDVEKSDVDWSIVDGRLLGGFMNLEGFGPAKAFKAVEQRNNGKLDKEKIAKATIRYAELYPLTTKYKWLYDDPEAAGCQLGSYFSPLNDLPPSGDVLLLASITKKELRDENEQIRVNRRDGKRFSGNTLFLDLFAIDDTGVPLTLRFDRFIFEPLGKQCFDLLQKDDVVMVRGKRIPGFSMVKVKRIKCMNREVEL